MLKMEKLEAEKAAVAEQAKAVAAEKHKMQFALETAQRKLHSFEAAQEESEVDKILGAGTFGLCFVTPSTRQCVAVRTARVFVFHHMDLSMLCGVCMWVGVACRRHSGSLAAVAIAMPSSMPLKSSSILIRRAPSTMGDEKPIYDKQTAEEYAARKKREAAEAEKARRIAEAERLRQAINNNERDKLMHPGSWYGVCRSWCVCVGGIMCALERCWITDMCMRVAGWCGSCSCVVAHLQVHHLLDVLPNRHRYQ